MISNSLKIAIRNFYKRPAFSIINVLGLAIGLACFVLTMVYVNYELSFDNHHEKKDRIYLVTTTINYADYFIENQESTTATLSETLKANFPEVETATQTMFGTPMYIKKGEDYFRETNVTVADSSFFDVFTYEFIQGDAKNALNEPMSVVLTEKIAKKYFGDEDAYGKVLNLMDENFKVMAIINDPPDNASFGFDLIISLYQWDGWYNDPEWQNNNWRNFVVLKKGIKMNVLEDKMPQLLKNHIHTIGGQDFESWLADGNRWEYHLFSLSEVYLDLWGNGIYTLGFGIVALFLLIIACINYMNLSTAKSNQRAKEVGLRKSFGAFRFKLIRHFLSESLFMSFISMIIGMGIVEACLPFLSEFVDKDLSIHYFDNLIVLPALFVTALIIGIFSGLYPAFILAAYQPVKVLKGDIGKKAKSLNLRNALVFLQFVISITLIISLFVVVKQTDLLYTKKLGYNKENLIVLTLASSIKNQDVFRTEIEKLPQIENLTFTSRVPNRGSGPSNQWTPEGKESTLFAVHIADEKFLETMEIELQAGRFFSKEFSTDTAAIVLNRAAMRKLNWGDTLSKTISNGARDFHVIGIIDNYHFQTLHQEIQPLLIVYKGDGYNNGYNYVTIRIKPGMTPPIDEIEKAWHKTTWERNTPFEYFFFDERYNTYYDQEKQTRQLMIILTILILFVTALGLYGLASYATQAKMKEIAIRKAIGSSVLNIVYKITFSFTKMVLIANIVAWPIAWYYMNDWLNNFATRITISWWIFILAALLSYLLAIITIVSQAYSAANKNPVDVLRYE